MTRPEFTHWVPEPVDAEHPVARTACGLSDYSGDRPPIAWTRSTDLESYQHRPYEKWPPPCPACLEAIGVRPRPPLGQ